MNDRIWFNSRLPQTLVIAQILCYIDAVFLLLALLGGGEGWVFYLYLLSLVGFVYGAYGIANELRNGYRVAIAAACSPIIIRLLIAAMYGQGVLGDFGFILLGQNMISALFEYALIGLLIHPMSREHQRIWFS